MLKRVMSLAAVAALGMALVACQSDGDTTAEFVGPDTNALLLGYTVTCPDGGSAADGAVQTSGFGFVPGATVTLRWAVEERDLYGSWPNETATPEGELDVRLDLPPGILESGDRVEIWAQGSGPEGITAMREVLEVGSC